MNDKAKQELLGGQYSIVVAKDDKITVAKNGEGIRPLLSIYRETPELLADAYIADKVIGKAAASILALSGVREVYGKILSKSAAKLLDRYGIPYQYGKLVDQILNRRGDGMCPMEQSVLPFDDREKAFEALIGFVDAQKK